MYSTRENSYWHNYTDNQTNKPYLTDLFKKVFCKACVHAAEIINNKDFSPDIDPSSENANPFISVTGIDDVLVDDVHVQKYSSAPPSQGKIEMFKSIFRDNYALIKKMDVRSSITENISRMLDCGDPSKGGTMYACPGCEQHVRFSPFHCGSRFCPSCGNKYNIMRASAMQCKLINAPHRHVTFTIPEELRSFFRAFRESLDDLYAAVSDTLTYIAHKRSSSEEFDPGFICVLHTFGRDLKWNPHIHVLLCCKIYGTSKEGKNFYLDYRLLRKSFQKTLLDRMKQRFGRVFSKLSSLIYKAHPNGFYIHAPKDNVNTVSVIKYIGRYLGRPPIASSRIDSYDEKNVTFHYTRHEDNKTVSETIPALDFIKRLIVHIPNKHFKMVRYYGFYSSEGAIKRKKKKSPLEPQISAIEKQRIRDSHKWRPLLIHTFGIDPLKCPSCGATMVPVYFTGPTGTYFYHNFSRDTATRINYNFIIHNYSSA